MADGPVPSLIAHRGHASRFPENTWLALESALASGVPAIEFDLQLTRDGVPVVIHDASLERTASLDLDVRAIDFAQARTLSVGEPDRFGPRHGHVPLASLAETVERLADWPRAAVFVEIKRESAEVHGVDATVKRVLDIARPLGERMVLISFVERAVLTARRLGAPAVGWCLDHYDADERRLADAIAPEHLLVDHRDLPADGSAPWPGPWQWAAWEIVDPDLAVALTARGVDHVETMACAEMLADPRLAPGRIAAR